MQDPIIGPQNLSARFEIPRPDGQPPVSFSVPRWTTTRASAYLLMPGLGGLRWLAQGHGFDDQAAQNKGPAVWLSSPPAVCTASRFAPSDFDPLDPDFLQNPYPYYALYRRHAPVAKVQRNGYEAYWIFGHAQCEEAALNAQVFLKKPGTQTHAGRGMFTMDDPEHACVRSAMDPAFASAMGGVQDDAQARTLALLQNLRAKTKTPHEALHTDVVNDLANPVFAQVFLSMFGLPPEQWGRVDDLAKAMLQSFCPMRPADQQRSFGEAGWALMGLLKSQAASACPAHAAQASTGTGPATGMGLFQRILALAAAGNVPALGMGEALATGLDFILGGYLSSAFLLGTALYHLQRHPQFWQAYRQGDAALRLRAFEEIKRFDAPFQLADRYAAQDMVLGGVTIPKDARVCLVLGSANHDEAVYGKTAHCFDIAREPMPHKNLVFGWGEHQCIGMPMAQRTVPTVMNVLADHCTSLQLDIPSARWGQDPYFRAFDSLPAQLRW